MARHFKEEAWGIWEGSGRRAAFLTDFLEPALSISGAWPLIIPMTRYCQQITRHYASVWSNDPVEKRWDKGHVSELPTSFHVLELRPTSIRSFWTYATCCMSTVTDSSRLELHLFSPVQHEGHVELLTAIAHYHRTGSMLALGHTVNFGRPWLRGSSCDYGLISLPYLDGPRLEHLCTDNSEDDVQFLWLMPITESERDYKRVHGIEALEQQFDEVSVNYLDPTRQSVV